MNNKGRKNMRTKTMKGDITSARDNVRKDLADSKKLRKNIRRRNTTNKLALIKLTRSGLFSGLSALTIYALTMLYTNRGTYRQYPSGVLSTEFWAIAIPMVLLAFVLVVMSSLYLKDYSRFLRRIKRK